MDAIYIEKVYHYGELIGIGMICRTKEQVVLFLRRVKDDITKRNGTKIKHYCEKELRIIYEDNYGRTTYAFEKRYVL